MSLTVYVANYCPKSQRLIVALNDCGIPFELKTFPTTDVKLPKWILELSPQGIFPILKEGETVVVGSDAISAHLEKHQKMSKLSLSSKKIVTQYNNAMIQCKLRFEPLIDQLLFESHPGCSGALREIFYFELNNLEASIKSPFYFGQHLSWLDIDYWTLLQRLPLLKYLHNIEIPPNCMNIIGWLDRLNKREGFEKAAYKASELVSWHQLTLGRGNSRPNIAPLYFTQILNSAIQSGVKEINDIAATLQTEEQVKDLVEKFKLFYLVSSEIFSSRMKCFSKKFEDKEEKKELSTAINNYKSSKDILLDIADKLIIHLQVSSKPAPPASKLAQNPFVEKNNSKALQLNLEKAEKENQRLHIEKTLHDELNYISTNIIPLLVEQFEKVYSDEYLNTILSLADQHQLIRKQISLSPQLHISIPWIIRHLVEKSQINDLILLFRFVMPFRFQKDVLIWIKKNVSDELWIKIRNLLDATQKTENNIAIIHTQVLPPVPPRKKEALAATGTAAIPVSHSHTTEEPQLDDAPLDHPIMTFLDFCNNVFANVLNTLKDLCISRKATASMNTLEDSLAKVFAYVVARHQQDDLVFFPTLLQHYPHLSMTIKGYLYDHQQLLSQIQHVFSLLAKIKIVGIQNIDLVNEMYDKVLCALTLVQHLLWKFDVDIGKSYLYLLHPNDQTRLLRESFDIAPAYFANATIPWIIRRLDTEGQVQFVKHLQSLFTKELFDGIFLAIRKVLPVNVANSLLSTQNFRKSM